MEGLGAIIALILAVMFGPPLLFLILGLSKRKSNPESAKIFYILSATWLIVGGGICATILTGVQ
jgi:hypothetical protein